MELDTPGLFERIAVEGQSFAESYLSETAVSQYAARTNSGLRQGFRFRGAITASVAGTNAPMDSTLQDNRFVPLNLIYLGHIQNRGDVNVTDGTWLGEVGSRRSIEGFTLWWAAGLGGFHTKPCARTARYRAGPAGASSPVRAVATHDFWVSHQLRRGGGGATWSLLATFVSFDRWACFAGQTCQAKS